MVGLDSIRVICMRLLLATSFKGCHVNSMDCLAVLEPFIKSMRE